MKNALLLLTFCAGLASCGSESGKPAAKESYTLADEAETAQDSTTGANLSAVARQPQVDTNATKIGTTPTGTPAETGAKLIAGSDCTTCHRDNEKLLGPAYKDVAAKYPNTPANVTMLAKKIITGGSGNWGDVAMTPHPGLSQKDAEEMTRYILSLK